MCPPQDDQQMCCLSTTLRLRTMTCSQTASYLHTPLSALEGTHSPLVQVRLMHTAVSPGRLQRKKQSGNPHQVYMCVDGLQKTQLQMKKSACCQCCCAQQYCTVSTVTSNKRQAAPRLGSNHTLTSSPCLRHTVVEGVLQEDPGEVAESRRMRRRCRLLHHQRCSLWRSCKRFRLAWQWELDSRCSDHCMLSLRRTHPPACAAQHNTQHYRAQHRST